MYKKSLHHFFLVIFTSLAMTSVRICSMDDPLRRPEACLTGCGACVCTTLLCGAGMAAAPVCGKCAVCCGAPLVGVAAGYGVMQACQCRESRRVVRVAGPLLQRIEGRPLDEMTASVLQVRAMQLAEVRRALLEADCVGCWSGDRAQLHLELARCDRLLAETEERQRLLVQRLAGNSAHMQ